MSFENYPYILLSYPRSGSNFIQNVLWQSTGVVNQSLYSEVEVGLNSMMTVKSHALSEQHLKQELDVLAETSIEKSRKRIILVRDPRDVMISFYEYVKARKRIEVEQLEFLQETDFYYASAIDEQFKIEGHHAPISVADAYRLFVRSWTRFSRDHATSCLTVSYENLMMDLSDGFKELLKFVNSRSQVAEEAFSELVSLYSEEERPRAMPFGWRKVVDTYSDLILSTEKMLGREIESLGYAL